MQGFIVSLCLAILEKLIEKGSTAFKKYLELKAELEANEKAAGKYYEEIKKAKNREDRRRAEDNVLS